MFFLPTAFFNQIDFSFVSFYVITRLARMDSINEEITTSQHVLRQVLRLALRTL